MAYDGRRSPRQQELWLTHPSRATCTEDESSWIEAVTRHIRGYSNRPRTITITRTHSVHSSRPAGSPDSRSAQGRSLKRKAPPPSGDRVPEQRPVVKLPQESLRVRQAIPFRCVQGKFSPRVLTGNVGVPAGPVRLPNIAGCALISGRQHAGPPTPHY